MLFISEKEGKARADSMKQAIEGDPEQGARRALEISPEFAPAWMLLGASTKDPQEAEAALWKALWLEPCLANNYLNLADILTAHNEADPVAKRLRLLALWKVSFGGKVPKHIGETFEAALGAGAWETATYEVMALAQESEFGKAPEVPGIAGRLRAYLLLNDLQAQAPDGMRRASVREIVSHGTECEPLFRNALREWARHDDALDEDSLYMLLAILGEISGPDAVDELIEMISWGEDLTFAHVHWALYRLGQRHTGAVLERYRAAAGGSVSTRCGIAEQMLMMKPVEGDVEVLTSLLEGCRDFSPQSETAVLLAAVAAALAARGRRDVGEQLASRYQAQLDKDDRRMVRDAVRGEYVPMLLDLQVAGLDIEQVCVERALAGEPEAEEETLPEDELEEEVDLAPAAKPGRNEPCWCGSGQKYKKCHLGVDQAAGRRERQAQGKPAAAVSLQTSLMHRVLEASSGSRKDADVRRAKQMYFAESGSVQAGEMEIDDFLQWMLHDFRDSATHRTAIENFLRTRGPELNQRERELLESLRDARFGLFEVERVEPGSGIAVHDVFAGDRMFVHDISSSNSMSRWDCLLARLQFDQGRWVFAGNGTMVPRNLLEQVRSMVERESRAEKLGPAEFVRANSHRMHRVIREMFDRNLDNLRVVNNEGEEVSFGRADYEISDEAALLAKLRSVEELEADERPDSGKQWFTWLQPMGTDRRPMGNLEIENGTLRLEAMSRTRLDTLRGLVEFHTGALLKHLGDRYTSFDEIKDRVRRGDPAPVQPLPSAAERQAIEQMLQRHYADWVNEKLPALGGKTPRQAMRSRAGRQAVIDLLHLMENQEEGKRRAGQPVYDFNIIRRQLELPEE